MYTYIHIYIYIYIYKHRERHAYMHIHICIYTCCKLYKIVNKFRDRIPVDQRIVLGNDVLEKQSFSPSS